MPGTIAATARPYTWWKLKIRQRPRICNWNISLSRQTTLMEL
jgi:hypothetical protein